MSNEHDRETRTWTMHLAEDVDDSASTSARAGTMMQMTPSWLLGQDLDLKRTLTTHPKKMYKHKDRASFLSVLHLARDQGQN